MVSFQCEGCGDVFTKKKLDAHASRCRNASFTCLDCHTTFHGYGYRSHTSCISEAQKYQGHLYQEKKGPKPRQSKPPRPTVEDVDSVTDSPQAVSLAKVEPPPPAPSPPAAAPAINVFDFLVKEGEEDSPKSPSSSYVSAGSMSDRSDSPGIPKNTASAPHHPGYAPNPVGFPGQQGYPHPTSAYGYPYYTYGSGPVEPSHQRYNSAQDLHRTQTPYSQHTQHHPAQYLLQTPAQPVYPPQLSEPQSGSRSEKKRKRSPSEINAINNSKDRSSLHTGLTGGLSKMLPQDKEIAHGGDASPLSPKKRSKRSREEERSGKPKHKDDSNDRSSRHKERDGRASHAASTVVTTTSSKDSRRTRRDLEAPPGRKAIEYHPGRAGRTVKQAPYQANSEFFLGLIDKDHRSVKGQSIWGALKMFHEARQEGMGLDEDGNRAEEKRLLKGLRCKINKNGEIVLFARPEAEGE